MELKPEDLSISTFNTGSAWVPRHNGVRVTHLPTKMFEECAEHRSEHANKRSKRFVCVLKSSRPACIKCMRCFMV